MPVKCVQGSMFFFLKNDLISGGGGWPAEDHKEREQGKLFMKRIFNFELFKLINI